MNVCWTYPRTVDISTVWQLVSTSAYNEGFYSWRVQLGTPTARIAGAGVYQVDIILDDSVGNYWPIIQDRPIALNANMILFHHTDRIYVAQSQMMGIRLTGLAADISVGIIAISIREDSPVGGPYISATAGVGHGIAVCSGADA